MAISAVDPGTLYRLPWTLPDNAISWLEPTAACNLACDGCYRVNVKGGHKPLDEVKHELDVFQSLRKSDCISIAGGDPLLYPDLVELVREVKRRGLKPIVNTNGKALTKELLSDLKKAGVFGFTFHVDSQQQRGGPWRGKNDLELNELRLHYAEMLAEAGGIACSFNATVYADNLEHVPELVAWAQKHIDIVQTMVFICFRHVIPNLPFDWYAGGDQVDWQEIWYHSDEERNIEIRSTDVIAKIRERFPDFAPAAYLNGTKDPTAMKWLLSSRIGTKDKIYGYLGPKLIEKTMAAYHLLHDRYLSYMSPGAAGRGRSALMWLWPIDKSIKRASGSYFSSLAKNPFNIFRRTYMQSIMVIQPVDFMENGEQSMCDGCPDVTVHKDRLVWSCRLEELNRFDTFLRSVPKKSATKAAGR